MSGNEMVIPRQMQEFMRMPKILPCPICFKRPQVVREKEGERMRVSLVCSGSQHVLRSIGFHYTLKDAIEDWNSYVSKELEKRT